MIEKYEQHFPHYMYIQNRFVLYSDSYAEIEATDDMAKSASKSMSFAAPGPIDYEKLQA